MGINMKKHILLWCFFVLMNNVETKRDLKMVDFVKHYVRNEYGPTFLISMTWCWNKNIQIALQKELSKINVRFSTQFEYHNIHNDHHVLFLIDLSCPNSMEILIDSTNLRSPYRWLALSNYETSSEETLEELPILNDSDFVLAERTHDTYTMTEIHKSTPNGSLIHTPRGYFNGSFVDSRPNRELYRRRRDVRRHPLIMANVIQDSNTTIYHLPREDRLKPHFDAVAKIAWSIVRLLFEMLNATPRYIFAHRWGYKQNGKWSGMIDDIHSGRADLGTNVVASRERMKMVALTDTNAPYRVKFIFRQPPLPYVANIFSLPFSTTVWIALVICVIISSFTLYLASIWEVRYGKSPEQLDGTFTDALLLTMCAVSQQGCAMEPRRISGRIMLFVVFTALMALFAAYSANIVVLLQAPSNAIQNLEQLAHSKLTIAASDLDYNHFVFGLHKDPVRVLIHKKLEPEKGKGNFYQFNEGVERIRKGLFAFHSLVEPVYRRVEQTFLQQEKCDLMEVDFMPGLDPLVPVKKDSPYLELFKVAFKQIHEFGIRAAHRGRLQVPKPRCSDNVSAFGSVGINDLMPVIIFFLYGFGLSVLILFLEIVYSKRHYSNDITDLVAKTTKKMKRRIN